MSEGSGELVLTPAGYRQLADELERRTVRLAETRARLRQALELAGDLGDNAEYLDAAREREAIEQRIGVLEDRLAAARVVEPGRGSSRSVVLGSVAELEDLDTGRRLRYELVSSPESNPAAGRVSVESPVGSAVVGHVAGDTLEVPTPHGRRRLRLVAVGRS